MRKMPEAASRLQPSLKGKNMANNQSLKTVSGRLTTMTKFTIEGTISLPNETTVLTGSLTGPRLSSGDSSILVTSAGEVEVAVISVGVGDPNLEKPNMQMVLSRIVRGDYRLLRGATLNFERTA
jgi:hypothetical protein